MNGPGAACRGRHYGRFPPTGGEGGKPESDAGRRAWFPLHHDFLRKPRFSAGQICEAVHFGMQRAGL